jgi:hypothetical protein
VNGPRLAVLLLQVAAGVGLAAWLWREFSVSSAPHRLPPRTVAACEQGRRVRYVTCAQLVNELVEAADERRLSRIVARYGRLDPVPGRTGLRAAGPTGRRVAVPDRDREGGEGVHRHGKQPPFSEWGSIIPDPRLVAAIVDRLTFHAHIIETGTESYRLRTTRAAKTTRSRKAG